jgi:putative salt-induced outer membrane protein YdiY
MITSTKIILLSFFIINSAHAFMNIESVRQSQKDGLLGQVGFRLSGAAGNTDKIGGAVSNLTAYKTDHREILFLAAYEYGESLKVKNTNKGHVHLRHGIKQRKYFIWEQFVQAQFDEFRKLNLRALAGGGARFRVFKISETTLYGGVGAFYEHEKLDDNEGKEDTTRANLYVSYLQKVAPNLVLSFINYYQPSFEDLKDFRFISDLGFEFKLTEKLSFKIDLTLSHDSEPPRGVKTTDFTYLTGLNYTF